MAWAMPALRAAALPECVLQGDCFQARVLLAGEQFRRAVG